MGGAASADEPDNIQLPQGFHATVVADKLGVLRHLAFRDNDNLYVSTQWNNTGTSGDLIALHLDKNRVADKTVHFGVMGGGTGIRVYKGALYAASLARIYRYSFHGKDLVPVSEPVICWTACRHRASPRGAWPSTPKATCMSRPGRCRRWIGAPIPT